MNVTRDIISDLWPLYESGEASDDTRRLVEQFLSEDIEFAKLVRDSQKESIQLEVPPVVIRDRELDTLQKTKWYLRVRDTLFFIAVILSFTPLTVYSTSWGKGWLIRDHPLVALSLGLLAVAIWVIYFMLRRRLRSTGL